MSKTLTFIDTGVLIAAARGQDELTDAAKRILDDPDREFAASVFVRLEAMPMPSFHRRNDEIAFLNVFFDCVTRWADKLDRVCAHALTEASAHGLEAMDALHVAAAASIGAAEFVTTEKPGQRLFRVTCVRVVSIQPEPRAP